MTMEEEEVKKHIGKKVLLILKNNYKFTLIIPDFDGHSFTFFDKFDQKVTVECAMISMIYEKENQRGVENDK